MIGFLWAAVGGAGTALPAILDRRSLHDFFRPLTVVLVLLAVLHFVEEPFARAIQSQVDVEPGGISGWQRHESALYWFDADWIAALVTVIGILAFDLVDRSFGKSLWLPVFAAVGGAIGYAVQAANRAGPLVGGLHGHPGPHPGATIFNSIATC